LRILILGAGGQGQVLADALLFAAEAGQPVTPVGYLDDNSSLWQATPLGLPVLGPLAAWRDIDHDALLLGIGANRRRGELYAALCAEGAWFTALRHPTAMVGHDVVVGPGSYIGAYVILAAGTVVGANAIVHGNSVIGHHNVIGDHVHIAPGVHTAGQVTVEAGAMVGIGANVLPQRRIGAWATVGAGAVVTRDLPDQVVAVGVPAYIIRTQG
jgi:sugar O-acyltransferase (sialic acid O-acetyltransferase NeuD family)